MDALQILKKDHQKAIVFFERIESEQDISERELLFLQLKHLLDLHTELEENIFYPALEDKESTADLAESSFEHHEDMKDLLDQLDMMEKDDPEWMPLFRQLREMMQEHMREEEEELFPKVKKALSRYEYEDLSNQLMQKKKHTGIVEIINDLVT